MIIIIIIIILNNSLRARANKPHVHFSAEWGERSYRQFRGDVLIAF